MPFIAAGWRCCTVRGAATTVLPMSNRRQPHAAYWEYLYIGIAVTAVCGTLAVVLGSTLVGVLLLGALVAELLAVKVYKEGPSAAADRERG